MGYGTFSATDWDEYTDKSGYATKSVAEIYTSRSMHESLDPKGVVRESCDSEAHPLSTPIIVGLDVTGSMNPVLHEVARKGLKTLCTEIHDRQPVPDPHILTCAIGDCHIGDRYPFQVTQFEADLKILTELEKLYLEGGGGGNTFESYPLAWYFAAQRTACDRMTKRGLKGYLFTIGDEPCAPDLKAEHIRNIFGDEIQADSVSAVDLLTMTQRNWEVFHLVLEQGNFARSRLGMVRDSWGPLLGQRVLYVADHTKIAEVIVSAIQVTEGMDAGAVASSWSGDTSMVVSKAVGGLTPKRSVGSGVVAL